MKQITSPNVFVENEMQSVIWMREEFHPRFVAILQTIYQRERLAYFNNHITITFDLANRAHPIN